MINSDEEAIATAKEIGQKLQELHNYLGDRVIDSAKIRFPRNYIRSAALHRRKYRFIQDQTIVSNIAYTKLTSDIFRWLLNHTDISLVAREMIIKQGIALVASVAEITLKEALRGQPGGGKSGSYKKRVAILKEKGVITDKLQDELNWLWDIRNNVHLVLVKKAEINTYKIADYNRAIRAMMNLRVSLGGEK